jgi:hypothetical protein
VAPYFDTDLAFSFFPSPPEGEGRGDGDIGIRIIEEGDKK